MDRALDLKPEVTQGCGFESRLRQDLGETLEQGTEPPTAPRVPQCRLPTAPSVCLDWLNAENTFHCSLYSV